MKKQQINKTADEDDYDMVPRTAPKPNQFEAQGTAKPDVPDLTFIQPLTSSKSSCNTLPSSSSFTSNDREYCKNLPRINVRRNLWQTNGSSDDVKMHISQKQLYNEHKYYTNPQPSLHVIQTNSLPTKSCSDDVEMLIPQKKPPEYIRISEDSVIPEIDLFRKKYPLLDKMSVNLPTKMEICDVLNNFIEDRMQSQLKLYLEGQYKEKGQPQQQQQQQQQQQGPQQQQKQQQQTPQQQQQQTPQQQQQQQQYGPQQQQKQQEQTPQQQQQQQYGPQQQQKQQQQTPQQQQQQESHQIEKSEQTIKIEQINEFLSKMNMRMDNLERKFQNRIETLENRLKVKNIEKVDKSIQCDIINENTSHYVIDFDEDNTINVKQITNSSYEVNILPQDETKRNDAMENLRRKYLLPNNENPLKKGKKDKK